MTETRFAVVGTGDVSRQVAADLAQTGNSRLVAVCSRSTKAAGRLAGIVPSARVYTDFDHCLADPDIDVVYVATPHATHHPLGVRVTPGRKARADREADGSECG